MFFRSNFINTVIKAKNETYVFWTTLVFYFTLWFINPGNKIIVASFVFLILIYYYKIKDIRISLLLAYLASLIVFTGKRYLIELVAPGFFPEDVFPQGHVLFFIISPKHILIFFILLLLIKDFIKGKFKKFVINRVDVLVFLYFVWIVISDILGSIRPEISLLFSVSGLHIFILYTALRVYRKSRVGFLAMAIALFASLIVFESLISLQQFMGRSPVFKNIEAQVDIDYFGHVADEPQFRYRPSGTFNHANELGMWLSFWLSVIFVYIFKKSRYFLFVPLILGTTALTITLSRSSWLGFGTSIMFILFVLEKVKKISLPQILAKHISIFTMLSLILTIFFIFPRLEKSLYTFSEGGGLLRYHQIQESIHLIVQNPFFGVGSGMDVLAGLMLKPSSVFSSVALSVHNWYILIAVGHGIPALALFLSYSLIWLRRQISLIFKEKIVNVVDYVRIGFVGGLFTLLIVGFFQPFIGDELILLSFAILGKDK